MNTESIHDNKQPLKSSGSVGRTVLLFGLGSSSSLFICFLIAYLFSKPNWSWTQFTFPKLFLVSAILLGISSYTIHQLVKHFESEDKTFFNQMFQATLGLTVVFTIAQFLGWGELYSNEIYVGGKPDGSYLYLISAIHALHVFGGLFPLFYLYQKNQKAQKDPVQKLLYYSSPSALEKHRLLEIYWHFVDVVWLIILVFFLFNHL